MHVNFHYQKVPENIFSSTKYYKSSHLHIFLCLGLPRLKVKNKKKLIFKEDSKQACEIISHVFEIFIISNIWTRTLCSGFPPLRHYSITNAPVVAGVLWAFGIRRHPKHLCTRPVHQEMTQSMLTETWRVCGEMSERWERIVNYSLKQQKPEEILRFSDLINLN